MTLSLAAPPCPPSSLSRLDPRWKLAALVLAAAAVAALHTWPTAMIALGGALLLAILGRLPPRWYFGRLAALGVFLCLFAGTLPFLLTGPGWVWAWGPLRVSQYGLAASVLLTTKALALVTLMLVLLATAPLDATLKAAHALHLPGFVVQLVMLTYRYVYVVADELARLRVALRVRGYRNRVSRHCYHTVGSVAGTLLVRSYDRAERVSQAMRCRGFDGRFRSLARFHTTAADVAVFGVIVGAAAGLLVWDRLQR
jgi:cobalt/nickel transport system permease protein